EDLDISERFALQQNALWDFALTRLANADKEQFARVAASLCEVVRFEVGESTRFVPAWADPAESQRLLADLLENRDDPHRLVAGARDWLSHRPTASAWVSDDAGLLDAESKMPLPRVGVANFSETRAITWAKVEQDARSPELTTIDPLQAKTL